jgi:hypothetical protein
MGKKPRFTQRANCAFTTSPSGGDRVCSSRGGIPDELYPRVRGQLFEPEITKLPFLIMTINAWSRVSIAFNAVPGSADKAYGLDRAGPN